MKLGQVFRASALVLAVAAASGCPKQERANFIPPAGKYDVRILRDEWGVPHIFGKTDADAAYGHGFAQCEDDWENVEGAIITARARMASVHGRDFAKFDYLMQLFRVREFVDAKYDTELSPDIRALCEAFADGISHFAAVYPERMPNIELPVTGKDIVAGATFKAPFFYELHATLRRLLEDEGGMPIGEKGQMGRKHARSSPYTREGEELGSNAFAVGPSRSADGVTRLAINSHQPWTGPVAWYEAHIHSDEGWNMAGGTFPGAPFIFSGHDENKGWCHTINRPDLVDVYELKVNPDNPNQYWFDGAWKDFERSKARMVVKLWGALRFPVKRELLWSEHGPVFRSKSGVYALRFVGYGEVGQLEQWFRMNKARNLDEFLGAMRLMRLTSLNTLYADKDGHLFYAYNGLFPVREEGIDWQGHLPGDRPDLIWKEFRPFADVPQVLDPASGMMQTCNNSAYQTTVGAGNPLPEQFSPTMGIETYMTNRSRRALELYGGDESITRDEFYDYKYDKAYSADSDMADFLKFVTQTSPGNDAVIEDARRLLASWDRVTTKDSPAAALAVLSWMTYCKERRRDSEEEAMAALRKAANILMEFHHRLDVPWSEMMRLRRGRLDLGLGGGPDCLRALDPELQEDGRYIAINGDCYFMMVEWDKAGKVHSESIHQFGAATVDEDSPHYADQAPLFAEERMKPVLLTEDEVRAHLKSEYRPGEFTTPWYAQ